MNVIGDLVARERRREDLALRTDSRAGSYSYAKCCTNAWKAGNLLRHYGVRGDATVAVDSGDADSDLTPPPILALFGAALLGATVRFDPPETPEARVLVAPTERLDRYGAAPGTQVLGYGAVPDDPEVVHFEEQLWSENPTEPPDVVASDAVALAVAGSERGFTHERLLDSAETVVSEYDIDPESEVVIRAPLSDPGTVVAGVLAPIRAGGTVVLDRSKTGTVGVATDPETASEKRVVDPRDVL